MQEIAARYPSETSYIFPFVTTRSRKEALRNVVLQRQNIKRNLKKIAVRCDLSVVPTFLMTRDLYIQLIQQASVSDSDILAVQTKAELLQICKKLDLYVSPNLKKDETVHRVAVAMMTNPINILSVFNKQELLIVNFPPVSIWPSAESNRRHPNS
jgi:hypothetical protein